MNTDIYIYFVITMFAAVVVTGIVVYYKRRDVEDALTVLFMCGSVVSLICLLFVVPTLMKDTDLIDNLDTMKTEVSDEGNAIRDKETVARAGIASVSPAVHQKVKTKK